MVCLSAHLTVFLRPAQLKTTAFGPFSPPGKATVATTQYNAATGSNVELSFPFNK